jgi:hypothetical protein
VKNVNNQNSVNIFIFWDFILVGIMLLVGYLDAMETYI